MKVILVTTLLMGYAATLVQAADADALKDPKEKFSYSLGMSMANNWKRQAVEVNPDALVRGVKDFYAGKTVLTEAEAREVLNAFQREMRAKQEEARKVQGEKNKQEGEAYLAANKAKDGVRSLPSGLQYKVLTEGKGESPKPTDLATVNYRGTLIDGTEFDSSFKRNQPATFAVNGVIKGWTEALQLMKPGAKWQLTVPPDLAYGERGSGANIGPNAVLNFEVELLSFKAGQTPPPATTEPVTSDIIKVPSKAELDKGAKIEVIKAADVEKLKAAEKDKAKPDAPKTDK